MLKKMAGWNLPAAMVSGSGIVSSRLRHDKEGTAETAETAEKFLENLLCGLCGLCGFF